ncbi:DUF397 domain-containing protein [Actinocorallia longicatena]|uniref:DUF397 domain-containing protein n=1 Tax=Actinocorallia longicatena TaxID=111803 RepID=A0ABP6QEU0_9ACTN
MSGIDSNPHRWRKSSYSGDLAEQCVEVGVVWRKSTHSGDFGEECVEVAPAVGRMAVRDSKHPERPHLRLTRPAWRSFLGGLKRGASA